MKRKLKNSLHKVGKYKNNLPPVTIYEILYWVVVNVIGGEGG